VIPTPPGAGPPAAEPVAIRRYPNRRFYDRSRQRYVTLGDIEELVRQGRTVEVRDSRTGEDLTRQVLTQILLERHPEKMELVPAALLHGLLRANDLAAEFWRAYLRQALLALEGLQRALDPLGWLPGRLPGRPAPAAPAEGPEALARRLAALEERLARLEVPPPAAAPPAPGGAPGGPRREPALPAPAPGADGTD